MEITWIVQGNLTKPEVINQIKDAVLNEGYCFHKIDIVPFSTELPKIELGLTRKVIYGSTTFMINSYFSQAYRDGVFFDIEKFKMTHYVEKWGKHILNSDGELKTLGDLALIDQNLDEEFFIRPNHDTKSFSGRTSKLGDLREWSKKLCALELEDLNERTEIWLSSSKKIEKEWRAFIVDDNIRSVSKYLENGKLTESRNDTPSDLIDFLQQRIEEYRIEDIYVMDVAFTGKEYKIIECNCFNGTGFYDHDIKSIVRAVNSYLKN